MKVADLNAAMEKYVQIRKERLELERKAETMKAEEDMLRGLVKRELLGRLNGGNTIYQPKGLKVKAELKMRANAELVDWDALQKHILATGEFDLLQKRVTVTAVRARWEVGKEVPGVTQTQEPEVTISVVKE